MLETIQRLLQFAHLSLVVWVIKSMWSLHINLFWKISMQECILDIQLMQQPTNVTQETIVFIVLIFATGANVST
jgi:hypothetical protein